MTPDGSGLLPLVAAGASRRDGGGERGGRREGRKGERGGRERGEGGERGGRERGEGGRRERERGRVKEKVHNRCFSLYYKQLTCLL